MLIYSCTFLLKKSYKSYDQFGRREQKINVSGNNKLQDEKFIQLKSTVNTIKEQLKERNSKLNFTENNLNELNENNTDEIKPLREANKSLHTQMKQPSKVLIKLQIKCN